MSKKWHVKLNRRRAILLAVPLCLAAVGWWRIGLPLWQLRSANLAGLRHSKLTTEIPSAKERVLVLAPHADDEVLACGGLIHEALGRGAYVQVALATNGDGFRWAATRLYDKLKITPEDFLALGKERQSESLNALALMGLPPERVTFLSYPDGGTAQMWLRYWDAEHRYTSPQTKTDQSSYPDSFHPEAPYCGRALVDDLKAIIQRIKPTTVLCPHPNDNHSDHWALNCYTIAALYELGMLDQVKLQLYLMHRGDWPVPQGLHKNLPLSPPAAMDGLDTHWESLPLSPLLTERKHRAMLRYHSQTLVLKRFMLSFVRSNELFGSRPIGRLTTLGRGAIRIDGIPHDWHLLKPAILDPAKDMGATALAPSADLLRVYAVRGGNRLFVRIDARGKISPEIRYQINLHPVSDKLVGPPRHYSFGLKNDAPVGTKFDVSGKFLEASLPWPGDAASGGIMLNAASISKSYTLDKTAWTLLRVPKEKPGPNLVRAKSDNVTLTGYQP